MHSLQPISCTATLRSALDTYVFLFYVAKAVASQPALADDGSVRVDLVRAAALFSTTLLRESLARNPQLQCRRWISRLISTQRAQTVRACQDGAPDALFQEGLWWCGLNLGPKPFLGSKLEVDP